MILNIILSAFLAILIVATVVIILIDDNDTSKKIAWLLIIYVLPVIGLVLYLIFGINFRNRDYFLRKHKRFISSYYSLVSPFADEILNGSAGEERLREDYLPLSRMMKTGPRPAVCDGNEVEVITSGQRKFELLLNDLKNARHYIHMEYFYFRKDKGSRQIKEILMQKASEGVKVRFVHENIANIDIPPRYYNEMKTAGVEVINFTGGSNLLKISASLNYRDHRKIAIIDGVIGYTGGMNITDDDFLLWRDTHLRITGNAVFGLQYSFLSTWLSTGGTIDDAPQMLFPSSASLAGPLDNHVAEAQTSTPLVQIVPDEPDSLWPTILMSTIWVIDHARKYIYMQTPYFIPPESLLLALKTSALSGCDVCLMTPRKPDEKFIGPLNRSYYKELLLAGVRIFEYRKMVLHEKTMVSDDYLSVVGTANMDMRSYDLAYEVNTFMYGEEMASINKSIFIEDLKYCDEITLEDITGRPWYKKIMQPILRLFAPLL